MKRSVKRAKAREDRKAGKTEAKVSKYALKQRKLYEKGQSDVS